MPKTQTPSCDKCAAGDYACCGASPAQSRAIAAAARPWETIADPEERAAVEAVARKERRRAQLIIVGAILAVVAIGVLATLLQR